MAGQFDGMGSGESVGDALSRYMEPTPINISKEKIDEFAEELTSILKFKPGSDIVPIVESLGGKIKFLDIDEWYRDNDGEITVKGEKAFCISLSNFAGPLRTRFTIAHELGHYILHSRFGNIKIRVHRNTDVKTNRVEWEANWFAAGFLMPKTVFVKLHNDGLSVEELASTFLVSQSAVNVRIDSLGL